ncbi:phytoene desaturase family protein [Gordonia lacunae]|uniref:Pyridine nucleotide-disulfide oxidoreductase domain-containing protein 2 n=1 Tax=Gordonia lacunae TaxID=417102 RepID=A0A2C9ZIK0_9ACTN|nr:NAD(P)/FAD-dependent oxidoreductase [Gordonia lacunae]OUC75968.1 FAD-dependent oxidoreductase [Gordonia lacunae]
MSVSDAVVIGAGHNGLIAAIRLADAGWDVTLLEAQPEVGGAVRSAELTPGYVTDLFSAFYPLAVASPVFADLDLAGHGLQWSRAPLAFGHPAGPDDVDAPVVFPDAADTAAHLATFDERDRRAWLDLVEQWQQLRPAILDTLFGPFPPVRALLSVLRSLGTADALRLGRFLILPADQMVRELFHSEKAGLLILGNALHADIPLHAPGSGLMGYLLTMLGQDTGYPVPVGGAGELSAALRRRAESAGVTVVCETRATGIDVQGGRATGVVDSTGRRWPARRAVLADVSAPALYTELLSADDVPARVLDDLRTFTWDTPVVKVNYAFGEKIPWRSANLGGAGTVHLGADARNIAYSSADIETGRVPEHPFLLFGQMTTADPGRSPAGTESAWSYSHLPRGVTDDDAAQLLARRMDAVLEAHAPGVSDLIVGRHVQTPHDLQAADANLVHGTVNGGTAQLFQQLIFRPTPNLGGASTPVDRLYLAGSGAHPGGGVHGACGNNAARAALASDGLRGLPRRVFDRNVIRRLTKTDNNH